MNIEWTANAIKQLNGIHDYIAKDSEFFAKRMVDRLTSRSVQIHDHPHSGEVVPEFGDETIREVIEGPCRVIYRVDADTLYVLSVIHGARMLTPESLQNRGVTIDCIEVAATVPQNGNVTCRDSMNRVVRRRKSTCQFAVPNIAFLFMESCEYFLKSLKPS